MNRVKKLTDITFQKERLIQRNPLLDQYSIVHIRDVVSDKPFEHLAEIIEASWAETYGKNSRLEYSKSYLEWAFGNDGINSEYSLAATREGRIAGIFLFTPRTIVSQDQVLTTGIQTGLSIAPEEKAQGLAKKIHLEVQEMAISGLDCHIYWYDSSLKREKTSHQIFSTLESEFFLPWGKYELKARIFDSDRAFENHKFSILEKPVVKLLASKPSEKGGKCCKIIEESDLDRCRDFLNALSTEYNWGRIYNRDEFSRYVLYKNIDSGFRALGFFLQKGGKIQGVAAGYTINTIGRTTDRVFFLDTVAYSAGVNPSRFLKRIEHFVYQETGAFGIITPDPRIGIHQRYLPSGSKLLCYAVSYTPLFQSPKKIKAMMIDHK